MKTLAFKSTATLENSRWYMGHLFTWLVKSEETGGSFALLETTIRKGFEPPPHTHTVESETYYVTEGVIKFAAGDETFIAKPGDCVHLPVGIKHGFWLETETAKVTILIQPGGFEAFFVDFSVPAESLTLPPPPPSPPSPELAKLFVDTLSKWGIDMPLNA